MKSEHKNWEEAARRLAVGEIGVIPTDTLYGVVGSVRRPEVVERIYQLRHREPGKALITLVADAADLALFQIEIDRRTQLLFDKVWPGPVSVIVPVPSSDWKHVHRGLVSVAFRVPAKPELRALLRLTGPLVAPSANLAGGPPATTVEEAREYFGNEVFYLDEGRVLGSPSALVDARTDPPKILRPAPGFRL